MPRAAKALVLAASRRLIAILAAMGNFRAVISDPDPEAGMRTIAEGARFRRAPPIILGKQRP